ncbi:MAG: HAMP domain-containing protein [Candidatus Methanoperedens sp.]|nr:HAMP domain-containing protein [Candidatus Methanoperedens sp.]
MKLVLKAFLPMIAITIVTSIVIGMAISSQIKDNTLQRAQAVTAEYIGEKAKEQLVAENFQDANFSNQFETFDVFLKQIQTKEVIKIKVFNTNHDIIYSTIKENIGEKTNSQNYEKAINGDVAVLIKDPVVERENIELQGYRQTMEIYVPIVYNGKVEGVIETYYKMDFINESIAETTSKVLTIIGLFSFLILIAVYLVLTYVVTKPINALKDAADKITDGKLDTKLPEAKSDDEVSCLIASIEMLVASYKAKTKSVSADIQEEPT